jgi:hypothetical protein
MTSTYTPNLGIQKPGTGDQAGSWGNTVNTNSDILDAAINGLVTLTLSGTSSTLTTTQGTLSNGQYHTLYLAGSPSGTHTITIDPNTADKSYFVYNTTAQSVIFTQGSGGNVTIPGGCTAILQASGAGATAAVRNIANELAMSAVRITGGTITGITELAVADGGTGASTLTGYVKGNGTAALTASATIPSTAITGLGTMAAQAASAVAITGGTITGGTITGITDLAVADGGTGASTGAGAIANFGLTASVAELNYVNGVTSAIQTQLNAKQAALGFTPVQQGGGAGQFANKIYLGWAGSNLKVQIDSADQGDVLTDTNFQTKLTDKLAGGTLNAVGTYAFLGADVTPINLSAGSNVAGSSLRYASLRLEYYAGGTSAAQFEFSSTSPSGTWKLMGQTFTTARNNFTSLFLRVA